LLSSGRNPFSYYEGVYFFDPSNSEITFRTINKNEMHSRHCRVSGDTLFHYAMIYSRDQPARSYSSAIVKKDETTIAYFATYVKSEELPELVFSNPLIYKRVRA